MSMRTRHPRTAQRGRPEAEQQPRRTWRGPTPCCKRRATVKQGKSAAGRTTCLDSRIWRPLDVSQKKLKLSENATKHSDYSDGTGVIRTNQRHFGPTSFDHVRRVHRRQVFSTLPNGVLGARRRTEGRSGDPESNAGSYHRNILDGKYIQPRRTELCFLLAVFHEATTTTVSCM